MDDKEFHENYKLDLKKNDVNEKSTEESTIEKKAEETFDLSQIIKLKVTDNKVIAYLELKITENFNKKIDIKMMRQFISFHKIRYGFNRNNIENLIDRINKKEEIKEKVIIAKGLPEVMAVEPKIRIHKNFKEKSFIIQKVKKKIKIPKKASIINKFIKQNKNEPVEYEFIEKEMEEKIPVIKTFSVIQQGEIIAEQILPIEGREGKDVFGNRIWSVNNIRQFKNFNLIADKNVFERSNQGKKEYLAKCQGIAFLINNKILKVEEKIDGTFKIKISEDKKICHITLQGKRGEAKDIDKEEIIKSLELKKIRYHKKLPELLESIKKINNNQVNEINDLVIAEAINPINGSDGYIKYSFDFNRQHFFDLNENRIDLKEMNLFQTIEKDQIIAEIIPPGKGVKNGQNVLGEEIPACSGSPVKYGLSEYVYQEGQYIKAKKSGCIFLKNNKIIINPFLNIQGDVNYSIGNIYFNGDLNIKGDVLDDFKVYSKGNIQIGGIVEGAYISSDSDIIINNGIKGKNKAYIKAKKNVYVKFCDNCHIEAEGDIIIENYSVLSTLKSKNNVIIGNTKNIKKGTILGGNIIAKNRIQINNAGNDSNGNNINLINGYDYYYLIKIKKIVAKITDFQFRILTLNEKLKKPEYNSQMAMLEKNKNILLKGLNKILQLQNRALMHLVNEKCEGIYIINFIYPNNTIKILQQDLKIKTKTEKKHYKLNENKKIISEELKSSVNRNTRK